MTEQSSKSSSNPLDDVETTLRHIMTKGKDKNNLPPVHLWNPPHCGDIGMEIRADGSWWHAGRRITRDKLVRLFSTILRKDDDGQTYLVTPFEKIIVHVEDAPFLAIRLDHWGTGEADQTLRFTTNLGDITAASKDYPLTVLTDPETGEPAPYMRIRGRLDAKLTRACFYELADLAVPNAQDNGATLGVWSEGVFFAIGPSEYGAAQ